ncbi:MAG TPA: hypothetical protein VJZ68_06820 [Nitrososphaera sp.]|nr:hypothetical protein [Nitrososphaera sp.]
MVKSRKRREIEDREKEIFQKRITDLEEIAAAYGLESRRAKDPESRRKAEFAEGIVRLLSELYGLHELQLIRTDALQDKVFDLEVVIEKLELEIKKEKQ